MCIITVYFSSLLPFFGNTKGFFFKWVGWKLDEINRKRSLQFAAAGERRERAKKDPIML